ncbi:MAG: hypothetical protein K9G46_06970 [Flavobacteriales bacterium]|nr:hypothetical protein [Flavobacteriales bacterium]
MFPTTELHKAKDGIYSLKRDGKALQCPFASPIMVRDSLNQVGQALQGCSSRCPLFRVFDLDHTVDAHGHKHRIALTCGSGGSSFHVTELHEESNLKIS